MRPLFDDGDDGAISFYSTRDATEQRAATCLNCSVFNWEK
jgi:hypothetical protein